MTRDEKRIPRQILENQATIMHGIELLLMHQPGVVFDRARVAGQLKAGTDYTHQLIGRLDEE